MKFVQHFLSSTTYTQSCLLNKCLFKILSNRAYFYADLVYRFKWIVEKKLFSDQIQKIIRRYKINGCYMDIMRYVDVLL